MTQPVYFDWEEYALMTSAANSSLDRSRGSEIVGRTGFSRTVDERILRPRLSFVVNDRASVIFDSGERSILDNELIELG
jgi:hypothetical protein